MSNSVAGSTEHVKHRCWNTRIKPLTSEQMAVLQFLLDVGEFHRISSDWPTSFAYANDVRKPEMPAIEIDEVITVQPGTQEDVDLWQWASDYFDAKRQPRHDMELAQEDYEFHGVRYATPWNGPEGVFD